MRRSMLLVGSLAFTLAGCGGDAFSAHADIAAEAAGQQLSAERVADILTSVKGIPANAEAAEFVASLWVDYTVFAQAVADGSISSDSVAIAEAMWVDVVEFSLTHWMDNVAAARVDTSAATMDSLFNASGPEDVRVLQHVLIAVDPGAPEAARVSARQRADAMLRRARAGEDFGKLALDNSGDPSAQADSGYLPPSPRGSFVPAFDSAAWLLAPGELSEVVVTSFGFHVIHRPARVDLGYRFDEWALPRLVGGMQQTYAAELDSLHSIELASGAVAKARTVFQNLDQARNKTGKIVNFKDGGVTEGMLATFVRAATRDPAQGPQMLGQFQSAPDSLLEPFLLFVGTQYVLMQEAAAAGVGVSPDEWTAISTSYEASVDTLKQVMGLTDEIIDPNATAADRSRAAALRVDSFFDDMITGQNRLRLLPGMLSWSLRGNSKAFVNTPGIQQAVALVEARLAAAPAEGVVNPATGGPPVPGAGPSPIQQAPGGPPVSDGQ